MEWKRVGGSTLRYFGKGEVQVGEFSSSTAGKALGVSATRTVLHSVFGDDMGVIIAAGNAVRASRSRMLLKAAHTGDISLFANQSHLKVAADESAVTGHIAGAWSYIECTAAGKVNYAAGHKSMADLPSGAVIASGGVLSAYMATSNDLGGTHTGKAVAFHVPNPVSGTWDAYAETAADCGVINAASTKSTPGGVDNWLLWNIAGTVHYIPMYHSKTA